MGITRFVAGPLSENVWCVPVGDGRVTLVDPGGEATSIIAYLNADRLDISAIVCTHGHFDHIMALPSLVRAFPGVRVLAHPADSRFFGPGAIGRHHDFFGTIGAGNFIKRYREELPPTTGDLLEGGVVDGWTVMHTPGHSPGSVCLYNEDLKTLISGDTLFRGGWGRTDSPGGDFAAMERSLARRFALDDDTIVLPGHGEPTTIGDERPLT